MRLILLGLTAGSVFCASCTTPAKQAAPRTQPSQPGADALRARAQENWTAKVAKDCNTLFAFLPGELGEESQRPAYLEWCKNEEPFEVAEFKILDAASQGNLGWVHMTYRVRFRKLANSPFETSNTWEKWMYENGNWYPVPAKLHGEYPEAPAQRDAALEAVLRKRYEDSWKLREVESWNALYEEFVDPQDREGVPLSQFSKSEGTFDYLTREVLWVEVIGRRGRVQVSYHHKVADPSLSKLPTRTAVIIEDWIERDGTWYLDLQKKAG